MKNRFDQSPIFNAAGLVTGTILMLIVAMAVSLAFDIEPAEAAVQTAAACTVAAPG